MSAPCPTLMPVTAAMPRQWASGNATDRRVLTLDGPIGQYVYRRAALVQPRATTLSTVASAAVMVTAPTTRTVPAVRPSVVELMGGRKTRTSAGAPRPDLAKPAPEHEIVAGDREVGLWSAVARILVEADEAERQRRTRLRLVEKGHDVRQN